MKLVKNVAVETVVLALTLAILGLVPIIATAQQEGAILYFPLDAGSGEVAKDHTGNGNDGALFGSPKWMNGKYGSGLYLDGKDDYIEINNILTESGTVEFWFKPDWGGDDKEDFRLFDASTGAIYFFLAKGSAHDCCAPDKFGFYFEDASDADWQNITFDAEGNLNASEWFHIAATWEFGGGFAFLYLNGEEIATSPVVLGGFPPLNALPRFGLEPLVYVASTNGATGIMDEIAIYDRALAPDEIAQDMDELQLPVEALDKAASTWGEIKASYSQ